MCDRDCKNCNGWTMCGVNTKEVRPNRIKWYAGFLNDGRQVTSAYYRHEVPEKAKAAAIAWGQTVSIKHAIQEGHWAAPKPGVQPDDESGKTRTYVIDGQHITVEVIRPSMSQEPDPVIDAGLARGLNITVEVLEAAAKANGKAHVYGGRLGKGRCWSFRSPVDNETAQQSLELYCETGQLDLAAYAILEAGWW